MSPVTTAVVTLPVTGWVAANVVPSKARTVNPVMGEPPSEAGAVQLSVAVPSPAVAVTRVGASATVSSAVGAGVTTLDDAENGLVPCALVAETWKT